MRHTLVDTDCVITTHQISEKCWIICKESAPRCRQITTPTSYHSIFTGRMLFMKPNQQCQNTERKSDDIILTNAICA